MTPPGSSAERDAGPPPAWDACSRALLEEANGAYGAGLNAPEGFRSRPWRLLLARRRRQRWVSRSGLAAAVAAVAYVVVMPGSEESSVRLALTSEPPPSAAVGSPGAAASTLAAAPEEPDSKGGLDEDVALAERARLAVHQLADPREGARLAEEHGRRFPSSPLRADVALLRVVALSRMGDHALALSESERLLSEPWARSLGADLHWLRGVIYEEHSGDCERAIAEYAALFSEPGGRGDEAEFRRARCLARIGASERAVDAFRRYLDREAPQRAAEARRWLSEPHAP